jgi:hypothetical protein
LKFEIREHEIFIESPIFCSGYDYFMLPGSDINLICFYPFIKQSNGNSDRYCTTNEKSPNHVYSHDGYFIPDLTRKKLISYLRTFSKEFKKIQLMEKVASIEKDFEI